MRKILLFLIVFSFIVQGASATIYYVNNSWASAADSNTGLSDTNGAAWKTITKCTNTITGGSTCIIMGGSYSGQSISESTSGSVGGWINYTSVGQVNLGSGAISLSGNYINVTGNWVSTSQGSIEGHHVILSGARITPGNVDGGLWLPGVAAHDIIVENCSIIGPGSGVGYNHGLSNQNPTAPYTEARQAHNITLRYNTVMGWSHNGIDINTNARDIDIHHNIVADFSGSNGIDIHNSDLLRIFVRNNTVYMNSSDTNQDGILIAGLINGAVENNTIIGYGRGNGIILFPLGFSDVGSNYGYNDNVSVRNNIMSGTYGGAPITEDAYSSYNTNILIDNNQGGNYIWILGSSGNQKTIIRNPPGSPTNIRIDNAMTNSALEYTDGSVSSAGLTHYPTKSNISLTGTGTKAWRKYDMTALPSSGSATVSVNSFNTALPKGSILVDFSATGSSNINFTIRTLKPNTGYIVKKSGVTAATPTADSKGKIAFANTSGSFTVEEGTSVPPPFDFSISNSGSITTTQGSSVLNTITANLISGTSEPVTFSVTGLPSSSSLSLSGGNSCSPTCSKTLTIYSTSSTAIGIYPITVSATNGTLVRTTKYNLTVNSLTSPINFSLSNSGGIGIDKGSSGSNTITANLISGTSEPVTFSVTGLPSSSSMSLSGGNSCGPTCSKTLTINTTSSTAIGIYPITVTAASSNLARTTIFNLIVNSTLPYKTIVLTSSGDTSLKSGEPDLIRNSKPWLDLGKLSGSTNGNYRSLLYFDMSAIPSSSVINTATLTLFWEGDSRNQTTVIDVFRPVTTWDALYTTWNSKQNGISWNTSGGDWADKNAIISGNTPYAEVTYPLSSTADVNFDVKSLVKEYVNGKYSQTGFILKANEVENTYISFHSSEAIDANKRPRLVINYSTGNVSFDPEDVNMDGQINQTDLTIVGDSIKTNTVCLRCDIDKNGVVDIYDVRKVSMKV